MWCLDWATRRLPGGRVVVCGFLGCRQKVARSHEPSWSHVVARWGHEEASWGSCGGSMGATRWLDGGHAVASRGSRGGFTGSRGGLEVSSVLSAPARFTSTCVNVL
ncbi:hypothetical protein OIU84_028776 [Salix udensis]|uniref:Uncharacterized protein n=1 Tax=Salix udensis TaxID=889485 RepID=A0AAD6KDD2_9ROSI|nr:hypothetical protein OIU84_028776 [Salix udensis]